jgi:magnesium-transporting ATPase (P-type)
MAKQSEIINYIALAVIITIGCFFLTFLIWAWKNKAVKQILMLDKFAKWTFFTAHFYFINFVLCRSGFFASSRLRGAKALETLKNI